MNTADFIVFNCFSPRTQDVPDLHTFTKDTSWTFAETEEKRKHARQELAEFRKELRGEGIEGK